jgi:hypothetical protein
LGGLFGFILYPWFANARNWVSIFAHLVFGAAVGLAHKYFEGRHETGPDHRASIRGDRPQAYENILAGKPLIIRVRGAVPIWTDALASIGGPLSRIGEASKAAQHQEQH